MNDVGTGPDPNPSKSNVKFAVVFKTYRWSAFIARQATRCAAGVSAEDFYISLDETSGPIGSVPWPNRVSVTCGQLTAAGFANSAGKGNLLWWNPDYTHYDFRERYPAYAYYVFVEHDAAIQGDLSALMKEVALAKADLVTKSIPDVEGWCWSGPHKAVYPSDELRASLIAVSIFSGRALNLLARRRREMGSEPRLPYWPSAEAFIPTEIERAGYVHLPMARFGSEQHLAWRPPMLESDLPPATATTQFLHPVLDTPQYLAWTIDEYLTWPRLFLPKSKFYRQVRRFRRIHVLRSILRYGISVCLPAKRRRGGATQTDNGRPPTATQQIAADGPVAS